MEVVEVVSQLANATPAILHGNSNSFQQVGRHHSLLPHIVWISLTQASFDEVLIYRRLR